ncbi:MAG: tRNA pseudouridine(38-40) synthase TruA [Selenomonadaceae bacterium]|nr:tRNA pseudouridine(38-40) synthase TruA [Selenomonadaceae bacterium]
MLKFNERKRNIFLEIAYDGTNYHGFQRQSPPLNAIQNILESKLQKIFGEKIELAAAGRTDAGVHACGQVVNFFTNGTIPIEKIPLAASSLLPNDIVILNAKEVDKNFHARYDAKSKIYIYRLLIGEVSDPFINRYAWHIRNDLDVEAMKSALNILIGKNDFSAFKAASNVKMNPVREIFSADIKEITENNYPLPITHYQLQIKIHADGFLYHMARNIVSSVVNVGRGRYSIEDFKRIFESRDRNNAAPTAPPQGLCLLKVFY